MSASQGNIRFGTNIITFFHPPVWDLPADLSHSEWAAEFDTKPRYYFEAFFDAVRDAGLTGVELAPDPGGWERVLAAFGGVPAFKKALESRGLVLTSSYGHGRQLIGGAMENKEGRVIAADAFRRHAQFLEQMGAHTIVSGNLARSRFGNESPDDTARPEDFSVPVAPEVHERFAEELNKLGAITGAYGVKIALHTDAYSICSRNEDIATVLSLTDPDTIALCPDAGHITLDGGDAVKVLRNHIERIPTMHWKDCAQPLAGHTLRGDQKERHGVMLTYFRVLGSGQVDWHEWMRILRDHRWSGWATEEIDMSPDPVGELRKGLAYFDAELSSIYS